MPDRFQRNFTEARPYCDSVRFAPAAPAAKAGKQLVFALGKENDLVVGLSTSGNSKNVVAALEVAKARGIKTVAMTGASGGKLSEIADITVKVPATETYKVQEYHLPVYHAICAEAERRIFGEN